MRRAADAEHLCASTVLVVAVAEPVTTAEPPQRPSLAKTAAFALCNLARGTNFCFFCSRVSGLC